MQKINLLDYENELSKLLDATRRKKGLKRIDIAESTGLAMPTCNAAFKGRIRNLKTLVKILYDLNIELYIHVRE